MDNLLILDARLHQCTTGAAPSSEQQHIGFSVLRIKLTLYQGALMYEKSEKNGVL
jgi:hypothetical protein